MRSKSKSSWLHLSTPYAINTSASEKSCKVITGLPSKVKIFRTAPVSSFTVLVKSLNKVSNDLVFRLFNNTLTAFLGFNPLRKMAIILGLIWNLGSSWFLLSPKLLEWPEFLKASLLICPFFWWEGNPKKCKKKTLLGFSYLLWGDTIIF